MPRVYLQSEVHRSISRDQPQRRRTPSGDPDSDQAKTAAVLRGRRPGIFPSSLVQIARSSPSQYESKTDVHLDFRKRRLQVQKL